MGDARTTRKVVDTTRAGVKIVTDDTTPPTLITPCPIGPDAAVGMNFPSPEGRVKTRALQRVPSAGVRPLYPGALPCSGVRPRAAVPRSPTLLRGPAAGRLAAGRLAAGPPGPPGPSGPPGRLPEYPVDVEYFIQPEYPVDVE